MKSKYYVLGEKMNRKKDHKRRILQFILLSVVIIGILVPTGITTYHENPEQETSFDTESKNEITDTKSLWDCITRCTNWGNWGPYGPWVLVGQTPVGGGFLCDYESCRSRSRHCVKNCWFLGEHVFHDDWFEFETQCLEKQCPSDDDCPATPTC